MATSFNRVLLAGKLNREPEMRQFSPSENGLSFGITVQSQATNVRGEPFVETCYLEVEAATQMTMAVASTLHQGMSVFLTGRLRYLAWQDPATGRRRNTLVVRAETLANGEEPDGAIPQEPAGLNNGCPSQDFNGPAMEDSMDTGF